MRSAFLVFSAVSLLLVVQADKRTDDVDISYLQTLVEAQAAAIQNLEARLDAQNTKIQQQDSQLQQQESFITSLQNTQQQHTSQISAIQGTQRKEVGFLADLYHDPNTDIFIQAGETVKFNNVVSNVGDGYDNVTGIFTAPHSGLYAFYLQFVGGNHDSYTFLGIYQGNYVRDWAIAEGGDADHNDQGHAFGVFHVTEGEEVTVKLTGGVGQIWGSSVTSFAGALIHAD